MKLICILQATCFNGHDFVMRGGQDTGNCLLFDSDAFYSNILNQRKRNKLRLRKSEILLDEPQRKLSKRFGTFATWLQARKFSRFV